MTEEERIAAEEAAKQEADKLELQKKLAEAEEAKANLVEEIQTERTKKQEAQKELEEEKNKGTDDPDADPEKAVERVLTRMQEKEAQANKESSLDDFKQSVAEFSSETDAAGLVFRKFEKELKKFDLSGLSTKEQYQARFKEVYDFMNRDKKDTTPASNFHTGTPTGGGSDPGSDDSATINDAESRLIKDLGWDKDRFLKAKAKRPHYVASLLSLRS